MKKNIKTIPKYILFTLIGVMVGVISTYLLLDAEKIKTTITNNQLIKTMDSKFDPVYEAYNTIKENYYNDIDDSVIIDGMVSGIMQATNDPYTTYYNAEDTKSFLAELSGSYYGIGAQIYQNDDNNVAVMKIFENSPAEKAGLQIADVFLSVDGESMIGKTPTDVSNLLRNSNPETSIVVVKRGEEEVTLKIKKGMVEITSVSYEKIEDHIGYISISTFSSLTDDQFSKALTSLANEGIDSLIIDLRGNSGGYLSTAENMISRFVDKKTVIYQIKNKNNTKKYYSLNDDKLNYKVVVLIDPVSASASEIMASALQEQYGAILVGKTTFGKGTVQQIKNLSNDTMFKYTKEEWLTSKGKSIDGKGVSPDYDIDLSEEYNTNPTRENDSQLQKAIELLK